MTIIERINKQRESTGLIVLNNYTTLGCNVIDIETGRRLFHGDPVQCQAFINDVEEELAAHAVYMFALRGEQLQFQTD